MPTGLFTLYGNLGAFLLVEKQIHVLTIFFYTKGKIIEVGVSGIFNRTTYWCFFSQHNFFLILAFKCNFLRITLLFILHGQFFNFRFGITILSKLGSESVINRYIFLRVNTNRKSVDVILLKILRYFDDPKSFSHFFW